MQEIGGPTPSPDRSSDGSLDSPQGSPFDMTDVPFEIDDGSMQRPLPPLPRSSMRGKLLVAFLVLWFGGIAVYWFWPERSIHHPPGMLAPATPVQTACTRMPWAVDDYTVYPLAEFRAQGLVLHVKRYHRSRECDLSPLDIALGWGRMSDQAVVDRMEISQSGRWYYWKAATLPIPRGEIVNSSSNMHILPANDDVRDALDDVCEGAVVKFSGYLVEVKASDGWHWRSSLTRSDEGDGSCEVVWVEHIDVDDSDPDDTP